VNRAAAQAANAPLMACPVPPFSPGGQGECLALAAHACVRRLLTLTHPGRRWRGTVVLSPAGPEPIEIPRAGRQSLARGWRLAHDWRAVRGLSLPRPTACWPRAAVEEFDDLAFAGWFSRPVRPSPCGHSMAGAEPADTAES
jgi:hypothetical protein